MLVLISGAAASGKKTIARAVAERLPALEAHHDNERPARTGEERRSNLRYWIEDALLRTAPPEFASARLSPATRAAQVRLHRSSDEPGRALAATPIPPDAMRRRRPGLRNRIRRPNREDP